MNEVHVGQKLPVGGVRGHINLPDLENHFIHLTVVKSYISHTSKGTQMKIREGRVGKEISEKVKVYVQK